MQFKNKLLTSALASVAMLSIVGSAYAVDIDVTVSGQARGDTTTGGGGTPLPFANEVDVADGTADTISRDDGVLEVVFDVETGTFPSGNVLMQLQLDGATFEGALTASIFDFTGCTTPPTAVVSIGGGNNTNTVTFVLSNLNGCADGDNPSLAIPFDTNASGTDVNLIMTILTESGNAPVDNTNALSIPILDMVSAFTIDIDTTGYADVIADVEAADGPYLDFFGASPATIGDVEVAVRTNAVTDLAGAGPVVFADDTDIEGAEVIVSGNMAAYGGAGDVDVGGVAATIAGSTATRTYAAGGGTLSEETAAGTLNTADDLIELDPIGTVQIQRSDYSVTVNLDLADDFNDETLTEDVLPVGRNGSFAILPWTASNTQSGGTGSQNFVRVSNPTTEDYGPTFATVLASTNAALVGTQVTLSTDLGAGEEALYTAAQLEAAIGNFQRADIEITVEGNDAIIARLVQRTDGTYEINNR